MVNSFEIHIENFVGEDFYLVYMKYFKKSEFLYDMGTHKYIYKRSER